MNERDRDISSDKPHVMLVGHTTGWNLESSYKTAFERIGCEVTEFDIVAVLSKYTRWGRSGRLFSSLVPVEPWIHKVNRDLVIRVLQECPDLLITFASYPVRAGALAQIKASTRTVLIYLWPDTLLNLRNENVIGLPIYDFVASYSQSSLTLFESLGGKKVGWVPLAGDSVLHGKMQYQWDSSKQYEADVTFIGGWRPEREAALSQLGRFKLKIWGPEWDRRCPKNQVILQAWQGRALFGAEFSKAVLNSKINLNIIDPTNYPAANMRFFEIPIARGLQVSSSCPEMENEFQHGRHVFYYRQPQELPDLIEYLLQNPEVCATVAAAGHEKVLSGHTYEHRAHSIIEQVKSAL